MSGPAITVRLDNDTGTFPFDVTSKVLNVDGYEVSRGRDDWIGAVTAGELRLTLNNSDGRFTPGSTILATPSPIKVDQRIRVSTVGAGFDAGGFDVGGFDAAGVRFTGYVKSWPVEWPAVVTTFATVSLTATDAQARAERRILKTLAEEEIFKAGIAAYYPLTEAVGATVAREAAGRQVPMIEAVAGGQAIVFGTDMPLFTDATGVTLSGGLVGGVQPSLFAFSSTPTWSDSSTFTSIVFQASAAPSTAFQVASAGAAINITSAGKPFSVGGTTGPKSVCDGLPHVISIQYGGGLATDIWVDGSKVATGGILSGPFDNTFAAVSGSVDGSAVAISQFMYGKRLSDKQMSDVHHAFLDGLSGELGNSRITRLAGYAGIAVGTFDTSLTNTSGQDIAGRSTWDAIQEVADAEMGLVFVDGSGNLTFHNRTRVNAKTAPDLTLDSQYVTPDVQPVTDDQQIVNYFEATSAATGVTSIVRNASSETAHGRYPVSETYLVQTDAEALDRANWIVAKQAEPTARYGTLTINLFKMTASLAASVVAAIDLDCWLRVTSMASQNPGGTVVDVVVQGWHEEAITGVSWTLTCNVVSRSLYTAFVLDSSLLDSTTLLAV